MSVRAIEFYFRGQRRQVQDIAPTQTVLQYLREYKNHEKKRETGTKEGCAEGDCGACMVVIGELYQGKLRLKSVNACIQFLPTLDKKALFTVEDLTSFLPNTYTEKLHPIQSAMVECHGSQCGFCTPGFIMSLWSMYENEETVPSHERVTEYLSGNLCRCTGYRPILDAAYQAYERPRILLEKQAIEKELEAMATLPDLILNYQLQHFFAPTTLTNFAELRQVHPQARIVAGCTDIGLWVTKLGRDLGDMLYIGQVAELKEIQETATHFEIGAGVNLTDAWQTICHEYPSLSELSRRFASMPIKNAGTLVGNVANGSPIGDAMPALMVINTQVRLRCGEVTRLMTLDEFYLGYQKNALQQGEFIEALLIPKAQQNLNLQVASYKISKRFEQDISAVCAAFSMYVDAENRIQEVAIAFGGMAAIPKRATLTEAYLEDKILDDALIQTAMIKLTEDYQPLNDGRASAAYRLQVAQNCLQRFYLDCFSQEKITRLADVIALVEI